MMSLHYTHFTLYPLYICRQTPQAASPAVFDGSGIVGTVLYGKEFGIYPTHSYWLWTNTLAAAELLVDHVKAKALDGLELNFPLHYYDVVQQTFPGRTISMDRFYTLIPSKFQPHQTSHTVVPVTPTLSNQVRIPDELQPLIGDVDHLNDKSSLYGIVQEQQLIALGEAMVDVGTCAGIGQIYTIQSCRGEGVGKVMLSAITENLLKHGKTPIYWVSEQNQASLRLVEMLGFELLLRLGCLEL